MEVFNASEAKDLLEASEVAISSKTGTVIIWEKCDRLSDNRAPAGSHFAFLPDAQQSTLLEAELRLIIFQCQSHLAYNLRLSGNRFPGNRGFISCE